MSNFPTPPNLSTTSANTSSLSISPNPSVPLDNSPNNFSTNSASSYANFKFLLKNLRPSHRASLWVGLATLLGAILRLIGLKHPAELIFDETYYVKDAWSLWKLGYEGTWNAKADSLLKNGQIPSLDPQASYVVHPPLGKWLLGVFEPVFGLNNPIGWRIATVCFGIALIALTGKVAWDLWRRPRLAGFAALLVAIDGVGITLSRIAILDVIFAFFALLGLWFVIRDGLYLQRQFLATKTYQTTKSLKPAYWYRPNLIAAGLTFGLGAGVKWSAIYVLAFAGLTIFWYELYLRIQYNCRSNWINTIFQQGFSAFLSLVPVAALTYLATWFSWFYSNNSYLRHSRSNALISWWYYHQQMWDFHHKLTSAHPYSAPAWKWLFLGRPTCFYWWRSPDGTQVSTITSLGNPLIWFSALFAFIYVLYRLIRFRCPVAAFITCGYLGTWGCWLLYPQRTIFQSYSIALLPFVALALTYAAYFFLLPANKSEVNSCPANLTLSSLNPTTPVITRWKRNSAIIYLGTLFILLIYFYPIWAGLKITYSNWIYHMWFPWWI